MRRATPNYIKTEEVYVSRSRRPDWAWALFHVMTGFLIFVGFTLLISGVLFLLKDATPDGPVGPVSTPTTYGPPPGGPRAN